jgi:tetratricopeptide (TPR) repeat protein
VLDLAIEGLGRFPTSSKLLVAFERAALLKKAVERANATYEALIENAMGSHGRRGIAYRHARWLERAGELGPALDAYVRAFKLSPAEGIAFGAIERLAADLGRFDALVAAMLALVERTSHVEKRLALMRNTVALCEGPIGDLDRAFDLMHDAWTSTGRTDLLPDLRRLARRLGEKGSDRGEKCFHEMVTHLDERIGSSWDADDQIRCLRIVASIHALELGNLDAALEAVARGFTIAKENEDIDRVEAAELCCDGAEYALAARSLDEAGRRARDALILVADHARAEDLAARATSMGGKRASAPKPIPVPKPAPAEEDVVEKPITHSWASAPNTTPRVEIRDPADALRNALATAPADIEGWHRLVAAADAAGQRGLASIAADVLAAFTGSASTHAVADRSAVLSVLGPRSMNLVHDPMLSNVEALLACLWEGAQPLFRKPLAQFGVVGTQRVTSLTQRPLATVYTDAVNVLGLDGIALFARPDAESLVEILATSPPSVVVHESIENDLGALPYRLARALSLATPSGVLVSSQDLERLEIAIQSLHAAFGPPDSIGTVGREAAALAAELWHTIPSRLQARMRDLLSGITGTFDLDHAIACVDSMSARAGLVVCGLPSQALMSAHADVGGAAAMSLPEFMEQTIAGQSIVRASLSDELVGAWNVALR